MPVYDAISRSDNVLFEPNSGVQFWVVFPKDYDEQFTKNSGCSSQFHYRVAWEDAAAWKAGMLGYTEGLVGGATYNRITPHKNPYTDKQYCIDVKLINQTMTDAQNTDRNPWAPDFAYQNFPSGGWVEYIATYAIYPYTILADDELGSSGSELSRYIRITNRSVPRERRLPTFGYETCEATPTKIPEVGFIPFVELELTYTQFEVPLDLVPNTAIANVGSHINEAEFEGYAPETVLFRGIAAPIEPYPGPSGELYTNLTYLFSYLPHGWNFIPMYVDETTNQIVWKRIRMTGSAAGTGEGRPLYPAADFDQLFKPRAS